MTTKRGKKPGWTTSVQQKQREVGDRERMLVLDAVLDGRTLLEAGHAAGVDRWAAEAIATAAGWSNQAMMQAARDRYAALVATA